MGKDYHAGNLWQAEITKMVFASASSRNYRFGMNLLKKAMKSAGISGPKLAEMAGCAPVEIWRLANWPDKKNTRKMTRAWAERLAPHLGASPSKLLFEESDGGADIDLDNPVVSSVDLELGRAARDVIIEADVRSGAGGGGVSHSNFEISDFNGNTFAAEGIAGEWSLPPQVMNGVLHAAPHQILAFEVIGDSMEPRLRQGDRVFVDRRMKFPNPPGIFVLWDGSAVVVKRLEIVHDSDPVRIRLISANAQYSPYEVLLDEANVIGRFVGRFTAD